MTRTSKVLILEGSSAESWEDAAQNALADANATLKNIEELEITEQSATVEDGDIAEYRTKVEVAFGLDF